DLLDPILISLGMVADSGEEFYVEVPFPDYKCTAFVREAVVPLLGREPNAACEIVGLRARVLMWLEIVRRKDEEVFICADYQSDLDLLCDALDYRMPPWISGGLIGEDINEFLIQEFLQKTGLPRHHALYDARANRYAHRPRLAQ
ncbi:MAG TPA: hypothetical protein VK832_19010, partial [Burkholderiaceae bacterium]|nr:hypothetical protein [Burkholderiaceae bacterium]